jgi:tetratricopeptide (TPR) repeat protein
VPKRALAISVAILLNSFFCVLALSQSDNIALNNEYTQALQKKDWPHATEVAYKLVKQKTDSKNLHLLGLAQLNSNELTDALATLDQAIAQASKEKPSKAQQLPTWKDDLSKIYVSKANTLLKLNKTDDALAAFTT